MTFMPSLVMSPLVGEGSNDAMVLSSKIFYADDFERLFRDKKMTKIPNNLGRLWDLSFGFIILQKAFMGIDIDGSCCQN